MAEITTPLIEKICSPAVQSDALQVFKSALAATVTWWISVNLLHSQLPFLAPWVALMTMQFTVYHTFISGIQTAIASVIGVGLSFVIGTYLDVNVWTFGLAMVIGLIGARVPKLRAEGIGIATTSIFLLASGFDDQQPLLYDRILEILLGVAVAIAINLIIFPPLRDQEANMVVGSLDRRMGEVLQKMADELAEKWNIDNADEWLEEINSINNDLEKAWHSVRFARESRRVNPRKIRIRGGRPQPTETSYETNLTRIDEGIAHLRHLARTLRDTPNIDSDWDPVFQQQWVSLMHDAGVLLADPNQEIDPIRDRLSKLSSEMSEDKQLASKKWPIYGSLLTSLFHLSALVDDAVTSRKAENEEHKR